MPLGSGEPSELLCAQWMSSITILRVYFGLVCLAYFSLLTVPAVSIICGFLWCVVHHDLAGHSDCVSPSRSDLSSRPACPAQEVGATTCLVGGLGRLHHAGSQGLHGGINSPDKSALATWRDST